MTTADLEPDRVPDLDVFLPLTGFSPEPGGSRRHFRGGGRELRGGRQVNGRRSHPALSESSNRAPGAS